MAMTVLDMATAVLHEIGELAEGSVASASDLDFIKKRYNFWRRNAELRDLVDWFGDDEEIPDGAELGVVYCVAEEVYRNFGVPKTREWKVDGEVFLHDFIRDRVPDQQTSMVYM